MERPLITAVTHSRDEARVTLLGVPDQPGRRRPHLHRARRRQRQRRHDHPERAACPRARRPTCRSPSRARTCAPRARRSTRSSSELGIGAVAEDPEMGKVSVVGAGMKSHPGVAAQGVQHARRRGDQHRDDLHVPDQDLVRRLRRRGRPRRARAARGVRARRRPGRGRAPVRSARHERLPRRRRRRHRRRRHRDARQAARAQLPRRRDRPVRVRALRRPRARRRRSSSRSTTRRSRASTSRSSRAGATTSGEWAPRFVEAGAVVVDNSSKFRRDPEIPLVVSEVNPDALDGHQGLIANPNCSTMQLMVALKPIYDAAGIERLIVSTYQSVSGTGVKAVEELEAQTHAVLHGQEPPAPRRSTRTRSRSTCSAAPATSPTATTTPTKSAR